MKNKIVLFFFFLSFIFLQGCGCSKPEKSLPIIFWDWQPEISLGDSDLTLLQQNKSPFVFIKTGAIILDKNEPVIQRKLTGETIESYGKTPLHLCYRASQDFIRSFAAMDPKTTGRVLGLEMAKDIRDAESVGGVIQGIQLDFDCPTRLLPLYTQMLKEIRTVLLSAGPYELSITAMETWLHHFSFYQLVKEVDFFVPVLYGYDIPQQEKKLPSLSSIWRLQWALRLSGWFGKPYWIGLPSYTSAIIYDSKGNLVSVENDLPLQELTDSQFIRYQGFQRQKGSFEIRHLFKVTQDIYWRGWALKRGYDIVIEETTAAQFRGLIQCVQEGKNDNLKGIACFRLDKKNTNNSLMTQAVFDLNKPSSPLHSIQISADVERLNEQDLTLSANLVNVDPYSSLLGYAPALLEIRIRDGFFESVSSGDFQKMDFEVGFKDQTLTATPERANLLRFWCLRIPPLGSVQTGKIRIRRTGPQFAVYLYGGMDSSILFKRIVSEDFEVFPEAVEPLYKTKELTHELP